jgi:hypothetical protein
MEIRKTSEQDEIEADGLNRGTISESETIPQMAVQRDDGDIHAAGCRNRNLLGSQLLDR